MKHQSYEEFISNLNPDKQLKVGNYEIPDDIYKQGGIPNGVINYMIDLVIAKDETIATDARMYYDFVQIMFPEDADQMFRIIQFLATIQCDLCTKMDCPKCPKRDEKGEQQ